MNKTLYDLTGEYLILYEKLSSGDEMTEDEMNSLMNLDGDISLKLESYGRIITEMEADSARLDAEIKRLQKRQKSIDNGISEIYNRVENTLIAHGLADKPIKTEHFTFSFRKSSVVEVNDKFIEWAVQYNRKDLLNYSDPTPNKTAIKTALDKGEEIPAFIVDKRKLNLK